MNEPAPLLEARDVTRRFHAGTSREVRALEGVSLAVPRGGFLALAGPSGCGKTTLLSLLAALDRPTSGSVRFDGESLDGASQAELSRVRRRFGLVFQDSPMLRRLPVWENVAYPLVPRGVAARARRDRAAGLLERVGLAAAIDKRPEELSGGELQRVGVARALVAEPDALLADEPTSNLDDASARAVADLLDGAHASGCAVIVATHDPRILSRAAVVLRLEAGRLA